MSQIIFIRRPRLGLGILVALIAALAGGFFAAARAQGKECREIGKIEVCADEVNDVGASGYEFKRGITIGPIGQEPVVLVTDLPSTDTLEEYHAYADYQTSSPNGGGPLLTVRGRFHLLQEPDVEPLVEGQTGSGIPPWLVVDPVGMRVYSPAKARWAEIQMGTPWDDVRNDGLFFGFIGRAGMQPFFNDDSYAMDMEEMDFEFDLRRRVFKARVPITLNVDSFAENADLRVFVNITVDEQSRLRGTVDSFDFSLAGFKAEARNIVLRPGVGGTPAEFEAAVVDISKADNPDIPALDAENPHLIMRLERLRYRDGRFTLGGGAIGLPDWKFGNAFQMVDQTVALGLDEARHMNTIIISSTLQFGADGAVQDSKRYPVRMVVGAQSKTGPDGLELRPLIQASLQHRPNLGLSILEIRPQDLTFTFDPIKDFYGLSSQKIDLAWSRGGESSSAGAVSGFKLGVQGDGDLVFDVGGGRLTLPALSTKAVALTLSGGFAVKDNYVEAVFEGTADVKLPKSSNIRPTVKMTLRDGKGVYDSCPVGQPNCLLSFDTRFSSFGLSIAGFTLELSEARGTTDGGLAVDKARLKLPAKLGDFGAEVNWLRISGEGDISFTGGSIELPRLNVGGVELAALRGSFIKHPDGAYEFRAAGYMPLPGLDPGRPEDTRGAGRIGVEVRFRSATSSAGVAVGVAIDFQTNSPGIPIGATGMELLRIKGSFDYDSGTVKLAASIRAGSQLRVANMPLVTLDGNAELQFNPFKLTANAKLSLLFYQIASANVGIGHQQGFNGGDGFNFRVNIDMVIVHGDIQVRAGELTLSNGEKKFAVAASAYLGVGLKEDQFGPYLPPVDINLASVEFKGGTFKVKGKAETVGLLGSVGCCVLFDATVFVDLGAKGGDVSFVDADDYVLIGAEKVRALAAQGVEGFSSGLLAPEEAQALGLDGLAGGPALQETVGVTVDSAGTTLFGISYPAGSPALRLRLPDGSVLTAAQANGSTVAFLRQVGRPGKENDLAFVVKDAQPGLYQLIIDNAPADYTKVSYTLNSAPALSEVTATCDDDTIEEVTVTCGGQPAGTHVDVRYTAADSDSPAAKVTVGYVEQPADGGAPDLTGLRVISDSLPLGQGQISWDLSQVPSGRYRVVVRVNDGQNAPADIVAGPVIAVEDRFATAEPGNVRVTSAPRGMTIGWSPSNEADLAGFEIAYAETEDGPFVYRRDLGMPELTQDENGNPMMQAQVFGLTDNQFIWMSVRSYDAQGNYSEWTDRVPNTAWGLAPAAWTPLPNGTAYPGTPVEVAFATPVNLAKPTGLLELRDAAGKPVAGRLTVLRNLVGDQAIGLRFTPSAPLAVGKRYTVVLKGEGDGVRTVGGVSMPESYDWSFRVVSPPDPGPGPGPDPEPTPQHVVYLPFLRR